MNKYLINIRMRDEDIPEDDCIVTIHALPHMSLNDVLFEIKRAFKDYDVCEGNAEPYREDGWGLESFIEYLKFRYSGKMIFTPVNCDASVELVGV